MSTELGRVARGLLHAPLSTAAIVATLSLGIGTTTAIFSVINGVLLRPLPFPQSDRLVMLWQRAPGVGIDEDWFSPAQYFDLREGVASFEHATIVFGQELTLGGDGAEPERLGALQVSSSWFETLGVKPALGRPLRPEDDAPGVPTRVLLSHALYRDRFGEDASIVGGHIRLDGEDIEVVGVLPDGLPLDAEVFPTLLTVARFDLVQSMPMEDPGVTTRGSENYNIVARLRDDAEPAQLQAELLAVAERFRADPGSLAAGLDPGAGFRIAALPMMDQVVGPVRAPLWTLLGSTLLLLAVGCFNVANLLLTRAATQRHELGLRAALGARGIDLMWRALQEAAVLAAASGIVGALLAAYVIAWLRGALEGQVPRLQHVQIDPAVLIFAALLCLASTLLFGSVPALRVMRVGPGEAMRETVVAVRAGSAWRRGTSRLLVAAQVAISLALVAGALVTARAFLQLRSVDPGFDGVGSLSFRVTLAGPEYTDRDARQQFFRRLYAQLREQDGVVAAGGVSMLPFTRGYAWTDFYVEGQDVVDARDRVVADVHVVTPGYFEALGVPLLAGRRFEDADGDSGPVVLVNRAFAERFWTPQQAIGKWVGQNPEERASIVGVVETVRQYGLSAEPRLAVYYPHTLRPTRTLYGVVRARTGDPLGLSATVSDVVRGLDPEQPVYDVQSMRARIATSLGRERLLMLLMGLFGAVALVVAAVGLHGVLSFVVSSHRHEIGVRKALGASNRHLYGLVLRGAALAVGAGLAGGVTIVLVVQSRLAAALYGGAEADEWSLLLAVLIVSAVAAAACWLPARRATAVDPMVALRAE